MKKFLLKIWDLIHEAKTLFEDIFWKIFDIFYKHTRKAPDVASVEDTIDTIAKNNYSIARFGDGEIKLVSGKDISFQKATPFVVEKLRHVLSSDESGMLIGIADAFGGRERYSEKSTKYWKKHLEKYRRIWYRYLIKDKQYYNASMTRQYITLSDKSLSKNVFQEMKLIWDKRDIVFIEGEKSRMGVGNDLFANAKSIKRIIGPSSQAFDKYNEILKEAMKVEKDSLILLALGPCATALAYDLHKAGYQAVDVGHVDIEYEWYNSKADKKIAVKNKLVHEAEAVVSDDFDVEAYNKQILVKIL